MRGSADGVRAIAEAMFASASGPPPAERIDWLVADYLDFVRAAGVRPRLLLGSALRAVTWVAPLAVGRRPPLGRLGVADRCRALERTEGSALGLAVLALEAILCIIYFEHPDAQRDIGVDTSCLGERS